MKVAVHCTVSPGNIKKLMMKTYTIAVELNNKTIETTLSAKSRYEALELAKAQYPYAKHVRIATDPEAAVLNLMIAVAIVFAIIFFFSPAIVLYDLYAGVEVPLSEKWDAVLYSTIAFVSTAFIVARIQGLLIYLAVCVLSSIGIIIAWKGYSWDFFGVF